MTRLSDHHTISKRWQLFNREEILESDLPQDLVLRYFTPVLRVKWPGGKLGQPINPSATCLVNQFMRLGLYVVLQQQEGKLVTTITLMLSS